VGPVGLEPTTRGSKGRSIVMTMASTCDYALSASPTSPTDEPPLTSFHVTNHAPLRRMDRRSPKPRAGFVPNIGCGAHPAGRQSSCPREGGT
jgi:hypothetical protein